MSPRTAAGQTMLKDPRAWWVQKDVLTEMILAIEEEASQQRIDWAIRRIEAMRVELAALQTALAGGGDA